MLLNVGPSTGPALPKNAAPPAHYHLLPSWVVEDWGQPPAVMLLLRRLTDLVDEIVSSFEPCLE
jgi:hypothetical protein